jgi:lipoprotein-anchoring transpeptidase ErfK/SrfK
VRLLAAFSPLCAGAAAAQYYYPYSYGGYPPPAYGRSYDPRAYYGEPGPYNEDFQPEARPRARRAPPDGYDDDPYSRQSPRRGGDPRLAALPPDADPAYSTPGDLDADVDFGQTTATVVDYPAAGQAGAITIDTGRRKLYFSLGGGRAIEYGVGVGREGFLWKGAAEIGRKAVWPGWTPPKDMLLRRPDLPRHMEGGIENPLGARALYLFRGPKDTMFRIHGTNEPDTIGQAVSSGCIRMLNADVIDLFGRARKGARVVVL